MPVYLIVIVVQFTAWLHVALSLICLPLFFIIAGKVFCCLTVAVKFGSIKQNAVNVAELQTKIVNPGPPGQFRLRNTPD